MITRLNGVREWKSWAVRTHSLLHRVSVSTKTVCVFASLRYWKCLRINIMTTLFIWYFDSSAVRVPRIFTIIIIFTDSFRAWWFPHESSKLCALIVCDYIKIDTLFMTVWVPLCGFFSAVEQHSYIVYEYPKRTKNTTYISDALSFYVWSDCVLWFVIALFSYMFFIRSAFFLLFFFSSFKIVYSLLSFS